MKSFKNNLMILNNTKDEVADINDISINYMFDETHTRTNISSLIIQKIKQNGKINYYKTTLEDFIFIYRFVDEHFMVDKFNVYKEVTINHYKLKNNLKIKNPDVISFVNYIKTNGDNENIKNTLAKIIDISKRNKNFVFFRKDDYLIATHKNNIIEKILSCLCGKK